ncbi:hypothetical protein BCON_0238g00030 [Botryotinia convoluta]|uniref:Major facilitator superfamily (MFS) profile domain-containing protein n=1 Tax=Botryotinia convoluta TaxID=54673 RepID=A0A4Z1HU90_9HELO|nr:hypothetical protein BCON_0238g00030 [Botryotinia convoluta]
MEMGLLSKSASIPLGTVILALLSLLLPLTMPYTENTTCTVINFRCLIRIDITGALLLLGLCTFIVTPLQLAATGDSFGSVVNIVLFICAGVSLAATLFWEWFVTTKRELPEPVFPWRFLTDRRVCDMILNVFFAGGILIVCIIQLPQHFQTVNEDTTYRAATRLLVFGIFIPIAGGVSSMLISNTRVPPVHLIIIGTLFQIAGAVGLSMTSTLVTIYSSQYAFLILAGAGIGVSNVAIIIMVPFVVQKRDLAVGVAVMTQFRVLGGTLGLSIVTSVMNRTIRKELLLLLTPIEAEMVLRSIDTIKELPLRLGDAVRSIFGRGYNLQMKLMIGFAIAQLPATALMWTKDPLKVAK